MSEAKSSNPIQLVSAKDIYVSLDGKSILKNANIDINSGEVVTLIGPNGAGKSTLIKVILGLLKADSGKVTRRDLLRIGYMPQKLFVDSSLPLTVKRFLSLAGKQSRSINDCLALTGTASLKNQYVQSLSGGELQRVLLARALFRDPQLLVLDEPVQGVDVSGQSALYKLINDIKIQTGCGILMVSHDLHLVMAATDRVVCLNQHICCEGSPDNISSHPEFLQLFGKTRDPNIAVYSHHHDHTHD